MRPDIKPDTKTDANPYMKLGLTVAVICAVADQSSKWWIMQAVFDLSFWPPEQGFPWREQIAILPFFNLVTVWNQGISFGFFSSAGEATRWVLVAVTSAIALGMMIWLTKAKNRFLAVGSGLILGGAVGNIMDRIRFGAVFDFLDFFAGSYHWPAFNISDSAITLGAILVLCEGFIVKKDKNM